MSHRTGKKKEHNQSKIYKRAANSHARDLCKTKGLQVQPTGLETQNTSNNDKGSATFRESLFGKIETMQEKVNSALEAQEKLIRNPLSTDQIQLKEAQNAQTVSFTYFMLFVCISLFLKMNEKHVLIENIEIRLLKNLTNKFKLT